MSGFFNQKKFRIGLFLVLFFFAVAIISLFWTPNNYNQTFDQILGNRLVSGPSLKFPLGTDANGRCILSRLMVSLRRVFSISLLASIISLAFGGVLGFLGGYFENKIDGIIMSIINIFNSIPDILLILVFLSVFGTSNTTLILVIGFLGIATPARLIRSTVKKSKNTDYIMWGKTIGAGTGRIIFVHLLPDVLPTLLVVGANLFSTCILVESAISYLGFVSPDSASLGKMLSESTLYFSQYPSITFILALTLVLLVLGFNLLAETKAY